MAINRTIILLAILWLVSACAMTPQATRDISTLEGIQGELEKSASVAPTSQPAPPAAPPEAVTNDLLPPALPGLENGVGEERFDVFVDDVKARDFFMGLVKDTHYNMVVHPEVKGNITLELRDVSVAEVMEILRDVYGYAYKKRDNLYQILPAGLRSEVFKIDYLSLKRRGVSQMQVSAGEVSSVGQSNTGGNSNNNNGNNTSNNNDEGGNNRQEGRGLIGTKVSTRTDADFWGELHDTLKVLIGDGEGRNVMVTPQAGIVVIRALPEEIALAQSYMRRAEIIMRRQVVLEAKILEVQLNDSYQSGLDWSALATPNGADWEFGVSGSSPVNPDGFGGVFGVSVETGDFSGVLELLASQGSVQVLSSPRISTVNNQKAVIKVGQDEFFVTDISNTTTTTTGTTTNNPDIELTPFFSGIALDVTPQISENDEIILHIHPTISDVEDQTKTIELGDEVLELPLALSTIRETDSIVFARSGQVVVLGGLMQDKSVDSNTGAPILGSAPLIGHLFSQQRNATVKSELVILLRPTIMGPDGMPSMLDESLKRFDSFHTSLDPAEQNWP
jgi:MSHA biogenesis protein MshL